MRLMLVTPRIEYRARLLLEMALSHLLRILAIRENMRVSNMYVSTASLGAERSRLSSKLIRTGFWECSP